MGRKPGLESEWLGPDAGVTGSKSNPAVTKLPSKNRSASQARRDRAALKRLQKSGTYSGKIDLRKAPSRYQLEKIAALKSRSKPKQPMPPKSKPPEGGKITRKRLSKKELEREPRYKLTTYALPFLRKGKSEPEWRRFTWAQLQKFMVEYKGDDTEGADDWLSYAVRETWTFSNSQEKKEFKTDVDLYFSGRRIDAPHGKIAATRARKRKAR